MRSKIFILAVVALGLALLVDPVNPVAHARSPKTNKAARTARKAFEKDTKQALREFRNSTEVNNRIVAFCKSLDRIVADVRADPGFAMSSAESLVNAYSKLLADLDELTGETLFAAYAAATDYGDAYDPNADGLELLFAPELGFVRGQCGPWDNFEKGLRRELDRHAAKAFKKLKKAQKQLVKLDEYANLAVSVDGPQPPAIAIPGGQDLPPTKKAFGIDSRVSGSKPGEPDTGFICVSGSADASLGSIVVKLLDENGDQVGESQTIEVSDRCRWRACFPADGSPTLPSGKIFRVVACPPGANAAPAAEAQVGVATDAAAEAARVSGPGSDFTFKESFAEYELDGELQPDPILNLVSINYDNGALKRVNVYFNDPSSGARVLSVVVTWREAPGVISPGVTLTQPPKSDSDPFVDVVHEDAASPGTLYQVTTEAASPGHVDVSFDRDIATSSSSKPNIRIRGTVTVRPLSGADRLLTFDIAVRSTDVNL